MSLDWNATNVRAYSALHDRDRCKVGYVITEGLIFASMVTGIPVITVDNWQEVYARTRAYYKLIDTEAYQTFDGEKVTRQELTPGMVRRRIGLKTNASRLTEAQFAKTLLRIARDRATNDIRYLRNKR